MINTIIVEDNQFMLNHMINMIENDGRFHIEAAIKDSFEAEQICNDKQIDLVLMDVQTLHNHSGLSSGENIKQIHVNTKVVIVTSLIDPDILMRSKQGASDSLWYKDHGDMELMDVINRTLNGEHIFPESSPNVEIKKMFSENISPRQIDILRRFVKGMTYDEIASELKLSKKITKPDFQGSFTASILAAAASPDVISFAGGLPNPVSFPVKEMEAATQKVLQEQGAVALQYSNTQGYAPLRAWIAKRYEVLGVTDVVADDIIITNGSQQALEMVGAAMIDPGDKILVEDPTYLVALQSFHLFDPEVVPVKINADGVDCDALEAAIAANPDAKFMYIIPNFQNPTGLTYTQDVRERAAEIFKKSNLLVLEDNPYSELRFSGEGGKSFGCYLGEQCCMFGTFSKILSPGMRMGWIGASREIIEKVNLIAQAAVLQTATINAMAISKYLDMFDIDAHVAKILPVYKHRCELMINTMRETFPEGCRFTDPDGGLFTWCELPEYINTRDLAPLALEKKVAFVPGDGFYPSGAVKNCMRLNYSNATDERLVEGVNRLAEVIKGAVK